MIRPARISEPQGSDRTTEEMIGGQFRRHSHGGHRDRDGQDRPGVPLRGAHDSGGDHRNRSVVSPDVTTRHAT